MKKKLKSLFLTIMSSLLLFVSCIKTTNKTSIDEVNYNNQPKSVFTLVAGDDYRGILLSFTLKDFCGAGGGGSAAIGAAVGTAVGTAVISGFGLGNSKTTTSNLSLDGVVEKYPELKKKMKDNGVSTEQAKEIIRKFLGLASITDLYRNTKKVLCIGRDPFIYTGSRKIKTYNEIAIAGGYSSFYVDNYEQTKSYFGGDKPIECANLLLVYYCCDNNWDFVCATHPYMYIHTKGNYLPEGGYSYRMELETIRNSGYNYVDGYTWNSLPPPTWTGSDAWWEVTSFYVTR